LLTYRWYREAALRNHARKFRRLLRHGAVAAGTLKDRSFDQAL
jgi:hypothetical protein